MKSKQKIQDRLVTPQGAKLKQTISSYIGEHNNNGLTLDENMFKSRIPTLSSGCFIDINKITVLNTCQRDTVTGKRLKSLLKIGKKFCPVKFGRVQLAKIEGDPNHYIFDALGRATVAYCLGIEKVPCEIIKFTSESEVLMQFFEQHDNEVQLSGWTRIETIHNAPPDMRAGYFKNSSKQTLDIYRVLDETGCVYDSLKATYKKPSLESCLTRFRDCITKEWSGNGSTSAGNRPSYALCQSLKMINRLWIDHDHKNVHANLLSAIVNYATDDGNTVVTNRDLERGSTYVKDVDNRLSKLEKKLLRIQPGGKTITQEEFWSTLLLCDSLMNNRVAIDGGAKIKRFVKKPFSKKYLVSVDRHRNRNKKK